MLPANRHLLPVIGIDVHMIIILGAPVPIPHPFIGLVFDPMDWIPKIGATVNVNSMPRGNSGTAGMLGCKVHIPMGGPFATPPTIGHDSKNFFGSPRVKAEGSYFTAAGFMVMSCNDIGMPLSATPGKNYKPVPTLYLPTSASIPIPGGKPVIVGGPYVPDLMGMIMGLVMSFGFGCLMKAGGALAKKALTKLNGFLKKKLGNTNSLSKFLCKHGFEPVNLITGSVLYEGVDFELPGPIPVRWERNWYSDSDYEGLLGHGTHCSYDLSLYVFEQDNAIGIMLPDGRAAGFPLLLANEEKFYLRTEKLTLTCKNRHRYDLFDHKTQLTYTFERLYDNVFKQFSISNASGLSIKFYYNHKYCLQKIIDTAGRKILIESDAFNRVVKIEANHDGFVRTLVEYAYNEVGDLIGITDALGQTTYIGYQNHLMIEKTDRNGQTFYWQYDRFSTGARCIHTYGDGGILEGRIEYRNGYNIVTNSLGESKLYYYDENNLCIQETDAQGNSVFHEYTDYMEPYRDIDEEGNITGYVYDANGNMTAKQMPDGSAITYLYDSQGRLQLITDAEGASTVYAYKDEVLNAVVAADNSVTAYEYYNTGLIKTITNGSGKKTLLSYDKDHNLASMVLPDGAKAEWEYDAWGRCIKTINPENHSQRFTYDLLDRVIRIRKYDGNNVQLKYDAYEEVVYAEDAHHKVSFEYTPLGSLKTREEYGAKIQFNYNTEERLISLLNEHNEVYRFKYDERGDIIEEIGFDGLRRKYMRSRTGKVIKTERPGGRSTEYEYDLNGRLIRAEYSDGSWEMYSYNQNGQLTEAFNENSKIIIQRDAAGRVIKDQQEDYFVESKYDKQGKRIEVTSNLGAAIRIERDNAGYVSQMSANNNEGSTWEARFKYNALGMETERLLPGGIVSTFEYDKAGHPIEHKVTGNARTMRHRIYSWNVNDRLQSMMNSLTNGIVRYVHDDFGNLAWVKYENNQYDYRVPDKVGNLYKTKERTDRKYGAGGRLLESEGAKYCYDEEGNLVSKTLLSGEQWQYEWSGNGMLKKVIRPDRKEVIFEYDALGRRSAKIYNGNITRWVWDGNTPLHEWTYKVTDRPKVIINEFGEVSKDKPEITESATTWVFNERTFKPAAKISNGKIESIITDYLGTPMEMYNTKGEQTWSVEYDIYGKIRKQISGKEIDCPFRYQGQYEDEEIGLYYNRFRYYDFTTGVYCNQDPIRLLGHNPNIYAYVTDVNSWIDPLGLDAYGPNQDVYALYNKADVVNGVPVEGAKPFYVGISQNSDVRLSQHTADGRFNPATDVKVDLHEDLDYAKARAYEQKYIEDFGTIDKANPKANQQNSFVHERTDKRGKAFEAQYKKIKCH